MEHYETTEKANRRQEYNALKASIAPLTYEEEQYRIHSSICEGTDKWLKKDETFIQWLKSPVKPSKPIWLQGIPGSGMSLS